MKKRFKGTFEICRMGVAAIKEAVVYCRAYSKEDAAKILIGYEHTLPHSRKTLVAVEEVDTHMHEIKEIRGISGLTQEDFALKYEIPLPTLKCWETGTRTPPDYVVRLLKTVVQIDTSY